MIIKLFENKKRSSMAAARHPTRIGNILSTGYSVTDANEKIQRTFLFDDAFCCRIHYLEFVSAKLCSALTLPCNCNVDPISD